MRTKVRMFALSTILASLVAASPTLAQSFSWSDDHVILYDTLSTPDNVLGLIPAIEHFDFEYEKDDHHMKRFFFYPPRAEDVPEPGTEFIHVGLWNNSPSFFDYDVGARYLVVPSSIFSQGSNEYRTATSRSACRGSCSVILDKPKGGEGFVFVLSSFDFDFLGDDHHIDTIGIRENNGTLTVEYNDHNNNDPFAFTVNYAYLPSDMVNNTATVGQTGVEGFGLVTTGMSGDVVLAGFRLDFDDDDHHITKITVDTRFSGFVLTRYADKNGDDDYSWLVDLVELN